MDDARIKATVKEATEFLKRAKVALDDKDSWTHDGTTHLSLRSRHTAALRRQSMELTRSLAALRKP